MTVLAIFEILHHISIYSRE